jgi:hypothetical protein
MYAFHVEDLTSKAGWPGCTVTALLGGTTCGVTLDEEDLAVGFGSLLEQSASLPGSPPPLITLLALHALACLAGGDTCRGGEDHLFADLLGFFGCSSR